MQVIWIQSTTVLLFASLCCLVVAIDGDLDGGHYDLIMERMPSLYEEWALTKRDVCAEAIPGTITSTCTPGNTLCCRYYLSHCYLPADSYQVHQTTRIQPSHNA